MSGIPSSVCTHILCKNPQFVTMLNREMEPWACLCELHYNDLMEAIDYLVANPGTAGAAHVLREWARARLNPLTGRPA